MASDLYECVNFLQQYIDLETGEFSKDCPYSFV